MSGSAASGEDHVDPELSGAWKKVQTAIWLIGLAILAWQGWWWPGILVLVAISGLTEAALHWYVGKQQAEAAALVQQQEVVRQRAASLPDACPNCGSPISEESVVWKGVSTATCPYCGGSVTGGKSTAGSQPAKDETVTE